MSVKKIILFRHGESDWETDNGNDHERPLVNSGIAAAEKMGRYLTQANEIPDYVISSTALRARTTAESAMDVGGWSCPMVLESGIYGGNPQFLLNLIKNQDDTLSSICLVGHEPNFSSFISQSTDSNKIHFPTASMAKIEYKIDFWREVSMGFGILDWVVKP